MDYEVMLVAGRVLCALILCVCMLALVHVCHAVHMLTSIHLYTMSATLTLHTACL